MELELTTKSDIKEKKLGVPVTQQWHQIPPHPKQPYPTGSATTGATVPTCPHWQWGEYLRALLDIPAL